MRLDRRSIIGAVLAVVAAVGVFVLTRPPAQVPVLVAAGDLPAGIPLNDLPVATRDVPSSRGLVEASDDVTGLVLSSPLAEGEPLLHSLLRFPERIPLPDAMALTLDAGHASQGGLLAGDLVDLYVTWPAAPNEGPITELLASAVLVIDAVTDDRGFGPGGEVRLLLAVDTDLAPEIVHAARVGEVDLVRVGR